jgi:hypothetical protein
LLLRRERWPSALWIWTLAYGYHEDSTPTHGYEPTRETAVTKIPQPPEEEM